MTTRGRPTLYTQAIADEICQRLADGESLTSICESTSMPSEKTVRTWALENYEGFSPQYARAREIQAHRWADEINEIGDDGRNDWMETKIGPMPNHEHITRSKLRCDNRKWLLSKLLPKQYGDKITQEHVGADGGPVVFKWQD